MSAEQIRAHLVQVAGATEAEVNTLLSSGRDREAKTVLSSAIRDLRDLKRACTDEQRAIREAGTDQRQRIAGRGQVVGLVAGGKARGLMAQGRAAQRRGLAENQAAALRPYDAVKSDIDHTLAQMDRAKAQIADAAAAGSTPTPAPAAAGSTPTPAPAAAVPPPPQPVATLRSGPPTRSAATSLRYWDGGRWTEHVSNRGSVSQDQPTR